MTHTSRSDQAGIMNKEEAYERMLGIDRELNTLSFRIDAAYGRGDMYEASRLMQKHDDLMHERRRVSKVMNTPK
ncbi:MAG: hypothetical protein D6800_09360 [Candidatus Zixiibacteriota bacterium]|nr:MAG: hypothetical protein D6800_09360 [candidate division Zixibacteria bacterium]